jgi:ribosomal protein S18 acetylase RimI-like enzyme
VAAQIRHYNPTTDAEPVAEFYNRNHYGPARDGDTLTGRRLNLVLAERGVHLLLVAEDRGRIIGTIGYLRVSGRRVSREDELFAGMFVIDPGYRAGFLAGRLFTSSFSHLLEDGITALRVEVNPANVTAFPLYIRVGFRSAEADPQPDQDGYIELVSHLPGVVSRLLRDLASDVPLGDVFSSFSWRTMAAGRNRSIRHGVTTQPDGDVFVEYDFTVRGEAIRVTVRMADGAHIRTTINGVVSEASGTGIAAPPVLVAEAGTRAVEVGEYSVELDADGTLSIRHPRYLGAVYRDVLPSVMGRPLAWRRPSPHRPLITEHRGGWLLAWQVDDVRVQKAISIEDDVVTTVIRSQPGLGLVAEPCSAIRAAVVSGRVPGRRPFRTPNVPGLWPRDVVDFEAAHEAHPFEAGVRTVIDEPSSGIRLEFEWLDAEFLRAEGQALGRGMTSGNGLRYSVRLCTAGGGALVRDDDSPVTQPDGIAWVTGEGAPGVMPDRPVIDPNWADETRGRCSTVVARGRSAAELVVVPDRGIASWRVEGRDVLTSPFPSSRTLGPLENWAAGLWVSTQGARDDCEHGVGWGGSPRVAYRPSGAAGSGAAPSWSVDVLDEEVSTLRLNLNRGDSPSGTEMVAHVTPKVCGPTVSIPAHPTGWWTLDRSGRRWQGFARAARIPVGEDRVLSIVAESAGDELLIRSNSQFFLVSLLSRAVQPSSSGSSWSLSVESSEDGR